MANEPALSATATGIGNKIPDTVSWITTPELSRLTKTSFDTRTKKAAKSLASKSLVDALDIVDKNWKKIKKLQTFDLSYLTDKVILKTIDCKFI